METYERYKGYGIRYYEIGGNTFIEEGGFPIKVFRGIGCGGIDLAKELIDKWSKL